MTLKLWNYRTEQYDHRLTFPDTDDEARQYISQHWASLALYDFHRKEGLSIHRAIERVLRVARRHPQDTPLWKYVSNSGQ